MLSNTMRTDDHEALLASNDKRPVCLLLSGSCDETGPDLNQAVIADGVTGRKMITRDWFDARHHLQLTVIGRKFREEVRDKRKEILALSGNATTRVADDAPRVNLDCGFATDRFDV